MIHVQDLEGGGEGGSSFLQKSSISIKGGHSPGTASKDRRGRSYLQHAIGNGVGSVNSSSGGTSSGNTSSSSNVVGGAGISSSGLPGNSIIVPLLVVVWYTFAVAAITTSKKIMNQAPLPYLLCTTQFFCALVATTLLPHILSTPHPSGQPSLPTHLLLKFNMLLTQVAITYTFGFIFTNMAFSVVTASFAETVKSAEPISSVILGYYILNELASTSTYLTLIPICAGVAISCLHDDSFAIWGFLYAAVSNICFSGRAVLAKSLLRQYPGSIDEIEMFRRISGIGLVVLVPLTLLLEGKEIHTQLWLSGARRKAGGTLLELASLAFINGLAYASYNLTSFLVLARTNLVTHAVLNCFRRVFIIVFTSYYFAQPISIFNMMGVALAVLGVLLFAYFRSKDPKPVGSAD